MSEEDNKALTRHVVDLINRREMDSAFELYTPDYIYHGPGGQELRGRDGIRGLWAVFLAGFPDLQASVDEIIAEADLLTLRWTVRGTHAGEFLGIAATGKRMALPITEVFRIVDGQLSEAWDQYDRLHLLEQIGAAPAPATP